MGRIGKPACQLRSAETLLACQDTAQRYPAFTHPQSQDEKEGVLRAAWEIRLQIGVAARKWFQSQSSNTTALSQRTNTSSTNQSQSTTTTPDAGTRDQRGGPRRPRDSGSEDRHQERGRQGRSDGDNENGNDNDTQLLSSLLAREDEAESPDVIRQLLLEDNGPNTGSGDTGDLSDADETATRTPPRRSADVGTVSPRSPGMEFTGGVPFALLQDDTVTDDDHDTSMVDWGGEVTTTQTADNTRSDGMRILVRRVNELEEQLVQERAKRRQLEEDAKNHDTETAARLALLENQVKLLTSKNDKAFAAATHSLASTYESALNTSEDEHRAARLREAGMGHNGMAEAQDLRDAPEDNEHDDENEQGVAQSTDTNGHHIDSIDAVDTEHTPLEHPTAGRGRKKARKRKAKGKSVQEDAIEDTYPETTIGLGPPIAPESDYDIHEEY